MKQQHPPVPYNEILQWPKTELHAHLNGCIREETLFDLAKERNVILNEALFSQNPSSAVVASNENDDHAPHMYNVSPRSLQDCFEMFAEIPKAVDDLPSLKRITQEALADFAAHHVAYLEIRTTPKALLIQHGRPEIADKRTYIETVMQVTKEFEQQEEERYTRELQNQPQSTSVASPAPAIRLPLVCRLLIAIDRGRSVVEATENVELALELSQSHDTIVGMDMGGNPTKQDFRLFRPLFQRVRDAGLQITIHCAEISCAESLLADQEDISSELVRAREELEAVLDFRPDRLGHALLLPLDLKERLVQERIPIESCPTSNIMTLELASGKACGNLIHALGEYHPTLSKWMAVDHYPLAICTDDPGVFCTTATQELLLVQHGLQVDPDDLQTKVYESLDLAFCDDTTKQQIRSRWKDSHNSTKV